MGGPRGKFGAKSITRGVLEVPAEVCGLLNDRQAPVFYVFPSADATSSSKGGGFSVHKLLREPQVFDPLERARKDPSSGARKEESADLALHLVPVGGEEFQLEKEEFRQQKKLLVKEVRGLRAQLLKKKKG